MAVEPEQLIRHLRRLASGAASPEADAVLLDHFIRRRDESSFAAVVQRHGPMVLGVCRRILGNVHDAEDAFQAAFLVLARKAQSVQPREALTAWLYGVARRVALKARTAQAKHVRDRRPLTTPTIDSHASPLDDLSSRELLALFDEELQRLPRVYRLPLILCCIEGHSQEEAARQLGWTPGSVKGRLERGRARLQARLTRRGLMLSAALMLVEAARGSVTAALAETTIRQSLQFLAGKGTAGAAAALAETALQSMSWSRSAVWTGLMSLLLVVAGSAGLALQTLADKPPEKQQPPAAAPEKPEPRKDQQGDPLPPGAIARLGTSRLRGVRGSLVFSPDGKWLAVATDQGVALWETTGRHVQRIDAPTMDLSFSPDGKRLACGDTIRCHVFDVATGKQVFAVAGTHGMFADDGKTLVTANTSFSPWRVQVWDAATGRRLRQWDGGEWNFEVAFSADGRTAAWSNRNKPVVQIRDLETGATKPAIPIAPNTAPRLALTRDGKTLAIANGDLSLRDVASGKESRAWKGRAGSRAVFSPDGKRLAWIGFGEQGDEAQLWTVERDGGKPRAVGEPVNQFEPPCFSPDGKLLAVATDAHVVSLRGVADGKEVVSFAAHSRPLIDLAFSASGQQVVSRANNELFVWQMRSGKLLRRLSFLPPGHDFAAPLLRGGYVLTGEPADDPLRGRFWLREPGTGRQVASVDGRPEVTWPELGPSPAAAAPGGRYAAVRGRANEIAVLDVPTGRCLYRVAVASAAYGLKLSADGDVLVWYVPVKKKVEVHVHRQAAKMDLVISDLPASEQTQFALAKTNCVSPDGCWLVLATEDEALRRWDLMTGKEAPSLKEALRTDWELVWSPDGRLVAAQGSASPDKGIGVKQQRDVRTWDVRTGTRLAHLTVPNPRGGMHVLFSEDGGTMLTTDLQGVIHVWEVTTGKERGQLRGHLPYEIGSLAFSPDGRMLASGGYDSQGFVWDLTGRMADGQWRTTRLSAEQRRAAWETLATDDAKAAYRAMWQLSADPEGTIALFRAQVRPVLRPNPEQAKRWLAALDSVEFAERERAAQELEQAGETVAADLRRVLADKPTLEVRRRIETLLAKLDGVPHGRRLQALRAVEVCERIQTPEARSLLQKLAAGAAEARLTAEARGALRRGEAGK